MSCNGGAWAGVGRVYAGNRDLLTDHPLPARGKTTLGLLLLALAAVLVPGYHPGADDAAIYVPAIKQVADPALYPFGAEFFLSHAHLSLCAFLVGNSARLSHLPIDLVILAWHAGCIFLLLAASWRVLAVLPLR